MDAQTYQIIARSNDSIHLYPNVIGSAIKSVIPNGKAETPNYRMIKKTLDTKESILFVEFINVVDKFLVTYETDLETPGKFTTRVHSLTNVFKSIHRVNAIYLEGEYLGMGIQVYQRPLNFKDVIIIDGINLQLPIKIIEIDAAVQLIMQNEEQKRKEAAAVNVTQEMIDDANDYLCEYYIAYLVHNKSFNQNYATEVREKFDQEKMNTLIQTLTKEQLKYIIREVNAQQECGKYSL
ncbi:MAG: hypothetical protein MJZ53_01710 [Paludibacteraceae bacterium]|nr:hypothetical protein [Paludibacteraceae bacterium]